MQRQSSEIRHEKIYRPDVERSLTRESSVTVSPLKHLKLLKWQNYTRAAYIIQKCYRKWLQLSSKNHYGSHVSGKKKISKKPVVNEQYSILNNVMNSCSNPGEKMELWRLVIELRRTRPQYSTDACLRALIECKGDLQRALIVTGNPTFGWRNADDLSNESREKVLPNVADSLELSSLGRDGGSPIRGGIRNLRDYKISRMQMNKQKEMDGCYSFDLSGALMKIYFSKQYVNSPFPNAKPINSPFAPTPLVYI
jgi:hypothetical protein